MGQRFRLKAGFDVSGFSPEVQVILRALKKYGMILADNGSSWFISGVPDERWDNDMLVGELKLVKGSDFEAIDESSLMIDPDSGQARQTTSDTEPPTAPSDLTATAVSSTQINLSWTASTDNVGVIGYRIYREGVQIATSPSNSYHDTELSPSTTYSYTVAAYDGAVNVSDLSNEASATTLAPPDTQPPTVPAELTATVISSTQINLCWGTSTDNVGVTGYIIYRNGKEIGTTAGTSYQSTGLRASTSYTYRVAAYDGEGNRSARSVAVTKTTQPIPSTKFTMGDRVKTIEKANVRSSASNSGTVLGTQLKGMVGSVIGGPWYWNQKWWWHVDFDSGVDGWVAQGKLKKVVP
jgi:chitodextrinase